MNEARHCQKQWLNWSLLRVERDLVPSVKSCPQTWVPTEAVRCSSSTTVSPSYHPAYINKIPRSFFNISSVPQCWNFTQSLLKFHLLERKAKAEMSSTFFFFCVCFRFFYSCSQISFSTSKCQESSILTPCQSNWQPADLRLARHYCCVPALLICFPALLTEQQCQGAREGSLQSEEPDTDCEWNESDGYSCWAVHWCHSAAWSPYEYQVKSYSGHGYWLCL